MSSRQLVAVEWLDHCTRDGPAWQSMEDVKGLSPAVCYSVGYLINETDQYVTIAAHVGPDDDDHEVGGAMCIVKSCIVRRECLR